MANSHNWQCFGHNRQNQLLESKFLICIIMSSIILNSDIFTVNFIFLFLYGFSFCVMCACFMYFIFQFWRGKKKVGSMRVSLAATYVSFDVNLSSSYSLIYHHPPIPLFIYTKSCNLIIQVSWKFHTCYTNYVLGTTPMAQCNCQFTDGNSSLVAFFLIFRCLLLCLRCCIYC